jgi:hypothetical protein
MVDISSSQLTFTTARWSINDPNIRDIELGI